MNNNTESNSIIYLATICHMYKSTARKTKKMFNEKELHNEFLIIINIGNGNEQFKTLVPIQEWRLFDIVEIDCEPDDKGTNNAEVLLQLCRKEEHNTDVDGYDINFAKRRVLDQEGEIKLTNKEFDLLVYFYKNKGFAIPRESVLSKVWDENYCGSDRVVDDTLRRIRKKMPGINICTIYGFGYRYD